MKVIFNRTYKNKKKKINFSFFKKNRIFYKILKIAYVQLYKLLYKRKNQQIIASVKDLKKYFDLCDDIAFEFSQFPRGANNTYEDPNFFFDNIGFHFMCKKKQR